mmetsp:Transcript_27662/g.56790  ORF Transcript_27662/g.56790 Transcript_27662/m.56790 type:complete len:241 (-) Transcript_27662:230-952(-)
MHSYMPSNFLRSTLKWRGERGGGCMRGRRIIRMRKKGVIEKKNRKMIEQKKVVSSRNSQEGLTLLLLFLSLRTRNRAPTHLGLEVLPLPLRFGGLGLEPRLNRGVLLREVGHVGHQVLDHVHVRQGVDLHRCSRGLVDVRQAGQGVAAVNVHGAGPADPFAAASAEAKRGVEFILDFQKSIEDHGAAFVRVDGVSADVWFLVLVRVISVDLECFDVLCLRASVHKTLAPRQTDTNIGALR